MIKTVYLNYYSKEHYSFFHKKHSVFLPFQDSSVTLKNPYNLYEKFLKNLKTKKFKLNNFNGIYKSKLGKKKTQKFLFKTCQIRFQQVLGYRNRQKVNIFKSCSINFLLKYEHRKSDQKTLKKFFSKAPESIEYYQEKSKVLLMRSDLKFFLRLQNVKPLFFLPFVFLIPLKKFKFFYFLSNYKKEIDTKKNISHEIFKLDVNLETKFFNLIYKLWENTETCIRIEKILIQ